MGVQNCYPNPSNPQHGVTLPDGSTRLCFYCDAVDAQEGIPAHDLELVVEGWDSGARSQVEHPTDCHTVFQVGQSVGVLIGFTTSVSFSPNDPATIQHGLYLWAVRGILLGQVYENGAAVSAAFARQADDAFEIRRVGEAVEYLRNEQRLRLSETPSVGALIVGCCLYMSGDTVL